VTGGAGQHGATVARSRGDDNPSELSRRDRLQRMASIAAGGAQYRRPRGPGGICIGWEPLAALLIGVRARAVGEGAEGLAAALGALLAGGGGGGGVEAEQAGVAVVDELAGVVGLALVAGGVGDAEEVNAERHARRIVGADGEQGIAGGDAEVERAVAVAQAGEVGGAHGCVWISGAQGGTGAVVGLVEVPAHRAEPAVVGARGRVAGCVGAGTGLAGGLVAGDGHALGVAPRIPAVGHGGAFLVGRAVLGEGVAIQAGPGVGVAVDERGALVAGAAVVGAVGGLVLVLVVGASVVGTSVVELTVALSGRVVLVSVDSAGPCGWPGPQASRAAPRVKVASAVGAGASCRGGAAEGAAGLGASHVAVAADARLHVRHATRRAGNEQCL
jgi:hypothetical protein